ncbi:MAG: hypothetical protein JO270_23920 [Acidobacteriaceae bacterium]|nr:hypothetical protein [Acidobacteriaceae bacterium]
MKALALLLCAAGILIFQEREGNFVIRFEPKAVLQANAPIPFQITVQDALQKPLIQATVSLQIETADHKDVRVYKAPAIGDGTYMAKPVFPVSGEWNVYVEVHRGGAMTGRTMQFNIPESAAP